METEELGLFVHKYNTVNVSVTRQMFEVLNSLNSMAPKLDGGKGQQEVEVRLKTTVSHKRQKC